MAGFLNANLPSDDEEDDEYNPLADDTAEKADRPQGAEPPRGGAKNKRRRGAAIAATAKADGDADGGGEAADGSDDDEAEGDEEDAAAAAEAEARDPRIAAKRARVASLWEAINVNAASKGSATERPPSAAVNLAALCHSGAGGKKAKKADPDAHWMRNLGLLRRPAKAANGAGGAADGAAAANGDGQHTAAAAAAAGEGPSTSRDGAAAAAAAAAAAGPGPSSMSAVATAEEKRALAAAALAAARDASAAGSRMGKVAVTEVRRFAGKDVQVTIHVDRDSKEAQRAAARAAAPPPASGGLDKILAEIDKKKKVSVLDKTKADWSTYKAANTEVDEELETYKKSSDQYLEKQSFLKRAELREYEKERDTRLASDVRTRGRL